MTGRNLRKKHLFGLHILITACHRGKPGWELKLDRELEAGAEAVARRTLHTGLLSLLSYVTQDCQPRSGTVRGGGLRNHERRYAYFCAAPAGCSVTHTLTIRIKSRTSSVIAQFSAATSIVNPTSIMHQENAQSICLLANLMEIFS